MSPTAPITANETMSAHESATPATGTGKPKVVLVHGSVMDGSTWRSVHDRLVRHGYRVSIVQMPLTGFDMDVTATKRVLAMHDGPVILVGHSYGGAVISVAGLESNVKALVYVAALQPEIGESVADLNSRFPMASHLQELENDYVIVEPASFQADVAADIDDDDAFFLANAQAPTAASVFGATLPAAAWHHKPSYGIIATQDKTVSPDLQTFMYERSGAKTKKVAASHSAHISQPDVVAEAIMRAADDSNNDLRDETFPHREYFD